MKKGLLSSIIISIVSAINLFVLCYVLLMVTALGKILISLNWKMIFKGGC